MTDYDVVNRNGVFSKLCDAQCYNIHVVMNIASSLDIKIVILNILPETIIITYWYYDINNYYVFHMRIKRN